MNLQPHQQRVVDERFELESKLSRLVLFFSNPLFATLDAAEQERLHRQAALMQDYSAVLAERIGAFQELPA